MLIRFLFSILLLAPQLSVAAPSCDFIHNQSKTVDPDVARSRTFAPIKTDTALAAIEFPTAAKAKQAGLKYEPSTKKVFINDGGTSKLIGTVEIIDAPFLYEWADKASSTEWIARGGIEKWEMDTILAAKGQSAGRGYYVSLSPTDSQSYGNALTIFRPDRKMLILKLNDSFRYSQPPSNYSEAFTRQLKTLGIDAVQVSFADTWYSVLSHDVLIRATSDNRDYLFHAMASSKGQNHLMELVASSPLKDKKVPEALAEVLKKSNLENSPYWALSEIFDIKYVSSVYKKISLAEPLPLAKMKEIALRQAENKKRVNLKKIKNPQDFVKAASHIIELPLAFREYAVEMGPEIKTRSRYIRTTKEAADRLKSMRFLTVETKEVKGGGVDVRVEYPSIYNYSQYESILSSGLKAKLQTLKEHEMESKKGQALNQELMQELVSALFTPEKQARIGNIMGVAIVDTKVLYQAFVAIHPFHDGNGRAGRIFYEMLQAQKPKSGQAVLTLPVHDMDLFMNFGNAELNVGLALRLWIAESKNDQEFMQRNLTALRLLNKNKMTKEMLAPFPEIKDILN